MPQLAPFQDGMGLTRVPVKKETEDLSSAGAKNESSRNSDLQSYGHVRHLCSCTKKVEANHGFGRNETGSTVHDV